jgi:hypothetical protein
MMILLMAELGAPGETVAQTEDQRKAENARAREVGNKVLDRKAAAIKKDVSKRGSTDIYDRPVGEQILYARALLTEGNGGGLTAKDLNASDPNDTLLVDRAQGSDVRISEIKGSTTIDGSPGYICKTPDDRDVPILADELIAAHDKRNAGVIASTYDDLAQAALVKWNAEGAKGDCPVPAAQVELMDVMDDSENSEAETLFKVNELISKQIDVLMDEVKDLRANGGAQQESERFKQLNDLLRDSQISTYTNGPRGILYKAGVLKTIQQLRRPQGETGNDIAGEINGLLGEMRGDGILQAAEQELVNTLHASEDITDARYDELSQQVARGDSLSVLKAEDVSALPGMSESLFGDENMTNTVIDRLIGNQDLDENTRNELREARNSGKLNKFNLLLLLLTIPVGVLAATVEGVSLLTKNQR